MQQLAVQFGGGEGLERSLSLSPIEPYRPPWICRRASPRWRQSPSSRSRAKASMGNPRRPVKPPARSRLCVPAEAQRALQPLHCLRLTKARGICMGRQRGSLGHGGRR